MCVRREGDKQMQFFGVLCNLAKLLLIAKNGGYDNSSNMAIGPRIDVMKGDRLDFDEVMKRMETYIAWLSHLCVYTMNVIRYII